MVVVVDPRTLNHHPPLPIHGKESSKHGKETKGLLGFLHCRLVCKALEANSDPGCGSKVKQYPVFPRLRQKLPAPTIDTNSNTYRISILQDLYRLAGRTTRYRGAPPRGLDLTGVIVGMGGFSDDVTSSRGKAIRPS